MKRTPRNVSLLVKAHDALFALTSEHERNLPEGALSCHCDLCVAWNLVYDVRNDAARPGHRSVFHAKYIEKDPAFADVPACNCSPRLLLTTGVDV